MTARRADPDRIRELAEQGMSQATIASVLGVSSERIRQICNRDGIATLSGKVNYDRLEHLEALSDMPMTAEAAAHLAGYVGAGAGAAFRRAGIKPPRPYTKGDQLRECAAAGMTLSEAARHVGYSVQSAWTEARRLGIVFHAKYRRSKP